MYHKLSLIKHLISINKDLIDKTAIMNCHCIGLNSFIINEKPKIRLFIAEKDCELIQPFDPNNPIIPIHPHKYDDVFIQIEGILSHHLYQTNGEMEFNKYKYNRLSDKTNQLSFISREKLRYLGEYNNITLLKANQLHTANIHGENCSWIIIETTKNENFEQISYHQNLVQRPDLYKKMINPIEYLEQWINKLIY